MRKIVPLLIILLSSQLYALNIQEILPSTENVIVYSNAPTESFFFESNNQLKIVSYSNSAQINSLAGYYTYNFYNENEFTYLNIKNEKINKTFMVLINPEILILYQKGSSDVFWEGINSPQSERFYYFSEEEWIVNKKLKASSELKEKSKIYSVRNLGNLSCGNCWSEGVPGNGIGEYIENEIHGRYLYFFSGYVDVNKPYLYKQNSRPKKIMIETKNQTIYLDLEDSPNPQKIFIDEPDWKKPYNIKITILEVYPGTKYDDTCINAIIGVYM